MSTPAAAIATGPTGWPATVEIGCDGHETVIYTTGRDVECGRCRRTLRWEQHDGSPAAHAAAAAQIAAAARR